jgi:AAA15 family ATPase/GTPase
MPKTQLKKLVIENFRALQNVQIEFGDHITVVCGKNGTSKSSILGIAAQIFSFEKDYSTNRNLSFRQIAGDSFKSQYSEHFRISDKFDTPGSMKVNIELQDGYSDQAATAKLELMKRQSERGSTLPRPVVRSNSTAVGSSNQSRNFTHPVIFLSLKRLYPIAARKYEVSDFEYLKKHEKEFISLTNELLNRSSSYATSTDGTISSAVAHGENYDHESVSAGEDNAGQIALALMSFRKLKEEYSDYKGGLLLIDEADAGLFPTAQLNLLKMLDRECKKLDLQVIMTSHSPGLIEYAFEQSQHPHSKRFRTVYLSNTYGSVQVMQDWSWAQINADINTKTIAAASGNSLPKVNVYFEDKEAIDFFSALMSRQPIKKFTTPMSEVTLGCTNYVNLIKCKVPEFREKSIVCLDSDAAKYVKGKGFKTVILLPGEVPPDQLIFEYLYNLPAEHEFWTNEIHFTRDFFTNSFRDLIDAFKINGSATNIKKRVAAYTGEIKPRDIFKQFYKSESFQQLVSSSAKPYNPWKYWIESNAVATNEFLANFKNAIHGVMRNGYTVDTSKLTVLKVNLKKVDDVL